MQLIQSLHRLSDEHAGAVMLGRTLLQSAPPVTFGLKAAGWFGAVQRTWSHVDAAFQDACVLQFGGASGTLAALGDQGIAVTRALAEQLQLRYPTAPWHAHRDRLATLATACGVYGATLGKMARDVALLMQDEIAEAFEPGADGRGESSSMPHKRNPTACSLALASATRIPGLVAGFLAGMMQEHESGVGGGQAEWATLSELIGAVGLALESMAEVAKGLRVDAARMRSNIDATRGMAFAERAMMVLAGSMGREAAHRLLEKAVVRAWDDGCTLAQALANMPETSAAMRTGKLDDLDSPQAYLGSAETFRQQLLRFRKTLPS
jgi:3-carboxy-cis,cis-muconate cycloisomerase